jgi:hypothetical protein
MDFVGAARNCMMSTFHERRFCRCSVCGDYPFEGDSETGGRVVLNLIPT